MNIKKIKLYLADMFKQNDILITTGDVKKIIRTNMAQVEVVKENPHVSSVVHYIELSDEVSLLLSSILPLDKSDYLIDMKLLMNVINQVKPSIKLESLPNIGSDITRLYPTPNDEIGCFEITSNVKGELSAFAYTKEGMIKKEVMFGVIINKEISKDYLRWYDFEINEKIKPMKIDKSRVNKYTEMTPLHIMNGVGLLIKDGITSVSINSYCKKNKKLESSEFNVKWYEQSGLVSPYIEYIDEDIKCISVRPTMRILFDLKELFNG